MLFWVRFSSYLHISLFFSHHWVGSRYMTFSLKLNQKLHSQLFARIQFRGSKQDQSEMEKISRSHKVWTSGPQHQPFHSADHSCLYALCANIDTALVSWCLPPLQGNHLATCVVVLARKMPECAMGLHDHLYFGVIEASGLSLSMRQVYTQPWELKSAPESSCTALYFYSTRSRSHWRFLLRMDRRYTK